MEIPAIVSQVALQRREAEANVVSIDGLAHCLAGAEKIETVQQASDLISKQIDTK